MTGKSSGSGAKGADDADADAAEFVDAHETTEDMEMDPIQECVSFCPPATGSGDGVRPSAMDDPTLMPPPPSKADWAAEVKSLQELLEDATATDEHRIRLIHEALVQRIEDARGQEEHKASMQKRQEDSAKERDRFRMEVQRSLAAKAQLEGTCRELQQQKSSISKENQRIAEEEESRHAELKEKFQQAIKDVQEKMDAELEVREHFFKENEELRGKLRKFTETYEAQEQQLAEQRESRGREMEVAQQRLKEHEVMCSESKIKTASLEKQNEGLRKSQTVLRDELQTILGKFDEFHEAVTGSNQRHGECKVEIDSLQSRLQELEKENTDLRNNKATNELVEEQKVAQKQRDALERLCDNLQKENRKHQEQLKQLQRNTEKR
mmetsp:Transcript_87061/g.244160  ORF Transcript_87061/g.244160 Transcript_87061/m.244160 type:complete len:381 (-) Transcript_87061:349-1491(-)